MNDVINTENTTRPVKATEVAPPDLNSRPAWRDAVEEIDTLWVEINQLMQRLRNVIQDYRTKQEALLWQNQKAAIDSKRDGNREQYLGTVISGSVRLLSGLASGVGAVAGASGEGREYWGAVGSGVGGLAVGIGDVVAAGKNVNGQNHAVLGDFQNVGAENYQRSAEDNAQRARDTSRQLLEVSRELVEAYTRISGAVKHS